MGKSFKAILEIIGINPFVFVPDPILKALFKKAGKDKGPLPVKGTINNKDFQQTLVRYRGEWRLYINTTMLKDSPRRIGETISVELEFDPADRKIKAHPKFLKALKENETAQRAFRQLTPSRQNEILRYLNNLKTEESLLRNIKKAVSHLNGKEKFVGRERG